MDEIKNPYQMDLIRANETKLYNQGAFWAFNTAKYRALLSNDPTVIKYWYRHEACKFFPDVYKITELQRSFYYGDEFVENAEEFFGIIPMISAAVTTSALRAQAKPPYSVRCSPVRFSAARFACSRRTQSGRTTRRLSDFPQPHPPTQPKRQSGKRKRLCGIGAKSNTFCTTTKRFALSTLRAISV